MPVIRLDTRRVEKPWGRRNLWPGFEEAQGGAPIGEIWFQAPGMEAHEPELLVKYLFTSEKLSIQVHPDDAAARAAGHARGKDEAWVVLAAEPHATIAIGTREPMTREELRTAALDGTLEDRMCWKSVKAGDVFYSPAGTVHAIGPGLTLVEVQQNIDLTYRLFDYGRPRELHLDAGVAVSEPVPYVAPHVPRAAGPGRIIFADGPAFVLERWHGARMQRLTATPARPIWIIPLAGEGRIGDEIIAAGGVWLADEDFTLTLAEEGDLLIAYPGAIVLEDAPAAGSGVAVAG